MLVFFINNLGQFGQVFYHFQEQSSAKFTLSMLKLRNVKGLASHHTGSTSVVDQLLVNITAANLMSWFHPWPCRGLGYSRTTEISGWNMFQIEVPVLCQIVENQN